MFILSKQIVLIAGNTHTLHTFIYMLIMSVMLHFLRVISYKLQNLFLLHFFSLLYFLVFRSFFSFPRTRNGTGRIHGFLFDIPVFS